MRCRVRSLPAVAAALLLAVTVAGSCGAGHWLLDLASHFRGYWLVAAAVGAVLALRRPRSVAFACCLLALAGNAWAMLPFWMPPSTVLPAAAAAATTPDADPVPPLELVSANLHRLNADKSRAVAWLRDRRPDVAVLLEIDAAWAANLSSLDDIYPHRIVEPREDNFGIAVLSRWPLTGGTVTSLGGAPHPVIVTTVRFHDRGVRLFAIHPPPPKSAAHAATLRTHLAAVAAAAAAAPRPCIVAGDFNATPWSLPYRVFAARSGLRDTATGRGVQPTWNARLPAPRIPIDHVFASPEMAVLRRTVGPDVGSDHLPVEATLALPPAE
ncbi:MAG: endonuclease/exonuclease/phosphatase family protein [Planctomycetaceae bacterium]